MTTEAEDLIARLRTDAHVPGVAPATAIQAADEIERLLAVIAATGHTAVAVGPEAPTVERVRQVRNNLQERSDDTPDQRGEWWRGHRQGLRDAVFELDRVIDAVVVVDPGEDAGECMDCGRTDGGCDRTIVATDPGEAVAATGHTPDAAEAAWIEWKGGCLTRPPKQSFMAGWHARTAALVGSRHPEPEWEG